MIRIGTKTKIYVFFEKTEAILFEFLQKAITLRVILSVLQNIKRNKKATQYEGS